MKTVTGKITGSTPVTIAKAASILSKFVFSETGASQALNAYLRRATAAFDELSRLHSKSDRRKHKKDSTLIMSEEAIHSELVNYSEQMLKKEIKGEGSVGDETERKKEKKRKKKGDLAEETQISNGIKKEKAEVEENGGEVVDKIEIRENGEKKKKKKRKSGEVDVKEEREDGLEEEGQRKKKRRRKHVDDN